jgi:hypothetical protein
MDEAKNRFHKNLRQLKAKIGHIKHDPITRLQLMYLLENTVAQNKSSCD